MPTPDPIPSIGMDVPHWDNSLDEVKNAADEEYRAAITKPLSLKWPVAKAAQQKQQENE